MKLTNFSRKADVVGITGSVLCILHCLTTPILLMTSALVANETVRVGYLSLDYLFIGINIAAVYHATRHNTSALIKASLWFFLGLFAVSLLLEEVNPVFEYVAYAASAGLVFSHLYNIRYSRTAHAH
ncbi:MerC domain-containing protein [Nibrella viscosa]